MTLKTVVKVKIASSFILLGGLAMGLWGCSSADNPLHPEQIISKALDESEDLGAYYAEAELITRDKNEVADRIYLKEWSDGKGKRRAETAYADGSGRNIAVNDGKTLISYMPETNQALLIENSPELLELNQMSPKDQAELLLKNIQDSHEIVAEGEDEVAGRKTYHISAKAKEESALFGDQEIWIDKETWLVLKFVSSSGDRVSEMVYTRLDLDPEFPSGIFTLDLPEDVQIREPDEISPTAEVTLEEAAEAVGQPFLHFPEKDGLALARIEKIELKGELNRIEVNLDYQKDRLPFFTLTVFESPEESEGDAGLFPGEKEVTIRGQKGVYMDMDGFRSLVWQENGLNYSILFTDPNLSLEEFSALAEGMILTD